MPSAPSGLPPLVNSQVESVLGAPVHRAAVLSGGDTSAVYRLDTGRGPYVLKLRREPGEVPALFFAEAQGLALLRDAGALPVPEVLAYGRAPGDWSYLLLSYLPPAPASPAAQKALGRGLAALHRVSATQFGGTPDNFMGPLPQANPACPTAAEFFWTARLAPQLALAGGRLSVAELAQFERLRERLPALIPPEAPALVHGDLWHGNALYTASGPALIDPAPTYSHREVDLSLMQLFGGFDDRVFAAYAEAFPLASGWQARSELWNLYPLLMHLNAFGASYLGRLRTALAHAIDL